MIKNFEDFENKLEEIQTSKADYSLDYYYLFFVTTA